MSGREGGAYDPSALPLLTADLAGTGGRVRESPEDFVVEEIPLYDPCGSGDHLYVRIEKRGIGTLDVIDRFARKLGISPRAIGYAGLKDARAVARQTLSIPGLDPGRARDLESSGIEVLDARRHKNKLKVGHLRGNRFSVRVRDPAPGARERALRIGSVLAARGVPNYFGEQRFGNRGTTHLLGRAILLRDAEGFVGRLLGPHDADRFQKRVRDEGFAAALDHLAAGGLERRLLRAVFAGGKKQAPDLARIPARYRKLYLSALQSDLFNRVVASRIRNLDGLLPGDLAWLHRNGAVFPVGDPSAEEERVRRFEISPSGPLFGARTDLARGEARAFEDAALAAGGLRTEDFLAFRSLRGGRRPLRVPLPGFRVQVDAEDLVLSFELPRGAYATAVLREIRFPEPGSRRDGGLDDPARGSVPRGDPHEET